MCTTNFLLISFTFCLRKLAILAFISRLLGGSQVAQTYKQPSSHQITSKKKKKKARGAGVSIAQLQAEGSRKLLREGGGLQSTYTKLSLYLVTHQLGVASCRLS